jgi:hypothetical protein
MSIDANDYTRSLNNSMLAYFWRRTHGLGCERNCRRRTSRRGPRPEAVGRLGPLSAPWPGVPLLIPMQPRTLDFSRRRASRSALRRLQLPRNWGLAWLSDIFWFEPLELRAFSELHRDIVIGVTPS